MTPGAKPLLLPLTCKSCGRDLAGGGGALVYACLECGEATHMSDPDKAYPLVYVRPSPSFSGQPVYAPFWRLTGRVSLTVESDPKRSVYHRLKPLGPLYFPAFWSPQAAYHDNLTVRLALAQDRIELERRSDPLLDGIRDPSVLSAMARLTWLGYLDRFSDVTGVELDYQAESVTYCAMPYFRQGGFFFDGVLGVQVPPKLFAGSGLRS